MLNRLEGLGRALIARAHNVIASRLGLSLREEFDHSALHKPGATFVTLNYKGRLRGCMGRLEAGTHTLDVDVRVNAHRAAFEDPRFNPVTATEWNGLDVEVSLLDAPQSLHVGSEAEALAALMPGVDGIIFSWGQHRSTFLPQVWEQLPERTQFMSALKQKAGLPGDFWADDVQLARYRVQKFKDDVGEQG